MISDLRNVRARLVEKSGKYVSRLEEKRYEWLLELAFWNRGFFRLQIGSDLID